jgi:hypothetical protein
VEQAGVLAQLDFVTVDDADQGDHFNVSAPMVIADFDLVLNDDRDASESAIETVGIGEKGIAHCYLL